MKNCVAILACVGGVLLFSCQADAAIYNPATGNWYDLVSSGADGSWANAEGNAVSLGGHLVTINDVAEEGWLRSTFGQTTRFWIGFTDTATEGTWVWSSGESVSYVNWDSGEPNNATPPAIGEDYAVLNWNSSNGAWNDWDHQRSDYRSIDGIAEFSRNPNIPEPSTCVIWALLTAVGMTTRRRRRRG
jgi:hypothetical protein